ncbi:hypothetical protein [Magnetococcus marinus]|nr:hypothetical protein [Magnetococcus marinus]
MSEQNLSDESTQATVTSEEQQRARRRKLIKGLALCAPMVVTLRPGAALAGGSNSPECFMEGDPKQTLNFGGNAFGGNRCTSDATNDTAVNDNTWSGYIVKDRSEFSGDTSFMTGGTNIATDDCLVFVDGTGTVNNTATGDATGWGNDGAHYLVKSSCWSSLAT